MNVDRRDTDVAPVERGATRCRAGASSARRAREPFAPEASPSRPWGEEDQSVPTFRTAEVLDSLNALGNASHAVLSYPRVGHDLRDIDTRRPAPVRTDVVRWSKALEIVQ